MWTSVERDEPHVVDHLLADGHLVARLKNLEVAVVAGAQPGHAERHAAVTERQILRAVGRMQPPVFRVRSLSLFRLGRQLRNSSIGRIGDERRPIVEFAFDDPEMVVVAGLGVGRLELLGLPEHREVHAVAKRRIGFAVEELGRPALQHRHFRIGEGFSPVELFGAFEGRRVIVRPTPCRSGWPSAVRGTTYALADGAPAFRLRSDSVPQRCSTTTIRPQRRPGLPKRLQVIVVSSESPTAGSIPASATRCPRSRGTRVLPTRHACQRSMTSRVNDLL